MSLSQSTQSWRRYYYFLMTLFILWLGIWLALYVYKFTLERQTISVEEQISQKERELSVLLENPKFKQYLKIQEVASTDVHIPWSDYVQKILEILDSLKAVEGESDGVELSDFKVDLNQLSLHGVVNNLKILYGVDGSGGLIDRFNQLDFLSDITIRKYEKREWKARSYEFTLSANVINNANATTGTINK